MEPPYAVGAAPKNKTTTIIIMLIYSKKLRKHINTRRSGYGLCTAPTVELYVRKGNHCFPVEQEDAWIRWLWWIWDLWGERWKNLIAKEVGEIDRDKEIVTETDRDRNRELDLFSSQGHTRPHGGATLVTHRLNYLPQNPSANPPISITLRVGVSTYEL